MIVEKNDTVLLSFTGKIDNGQIFKEVTADNPLKIIIGNQELPPTVENAITGMKEGEAKKVRITSEEGYGPRLKELIHELPLSTFGDRISPKPGMILSQKIEKDGTQHEIPVTIVEIKNDKVTIDYNHPAAGHDLTYVITVMKIIKN